MNNKLQFNNLNFPAFLHGADYNYEQWIDFPEILESDFRLMKESGCNVVSIGIFSWGMLEPQEGVFNFSWMDKLFDRLEENDIYAILATPSGSKPSWLSNKYPEVCRVGVDGKREPHGLRHNHCRTSPVYREKTSIINKKLAERYGNRKNLILWHVSNEYNSGECRCNHCINAFQDWLKNRYQTLEQLNKAWWTTFWSHQYTNWEQIKPEDMSIHGLMLDWKRFISDQTLDFYKSEIDVLKEITPNIPVTTNFMLPDVGLNYWDFAKYVDVISWDSYPRWHFGEDEWKEGAKTAFFHDLHRSFKHSSFMLMESTPSATNWQGISVPKKTNMHQLSSLQAIAHGSNSVQYFQWRQSRGGEEKFHGAVLTHSGSSNTQVFKDVTTVGSNLKALYPLLESQNQSEVGIIYDFENEWALSLAQLTRNEEKSYQDRCISHYRSFWEQGVSCDIIDSFSSELNNYKLVVAPMLYMLRNGVAEKLADYVKNGGTLVITYLTGLVDSSDLCFLGGFPGPLSEVAGLKVEYTDIIEPPIIQSVSIKGKEYSVYHYADLVHLNSATAQGSYTKGNMKDSPAITKNIFGKGECWYLAPRLEDNFYSDFYSQLLCDLKIKSCYSGILPQGVTCQRRSIDNSDFLFFMNFTDKKIELSLESNIYWDMITWVEIKNILDIPNYGIKILRRMEK